MFITREIHKQNMETLPDPESNEILISSARIMSLMLYFVDSLAIAQRCFRLICEASSFDYFSLVYRRTAPRCLIFQVDMQ